MEGSSFGMFSSDCGARLDPRKNRSYPCPLSASNATIMLAFIVTITAMGGKNWCMSKLKGCMVQWCSHTCTCMHTLPVYLLRQIPTCTRPMVNSFLRYTTVHSNQSLSPRRCHGMPNHFCFLSVKEPRLFGYLAPHRQPSHGVDLSSH